MFDIMRNVSGLAVPVIEPVQLENKLPGLGMAVTVKSRPTAREVPVKPGEIVPGPEVSKVMELCVE